MKYLFQLSSLFLFSSVLLFVSCDQPFQPLKENRTSPFSIFGYLDASVDTQWVRVSTLREQLDSYTEIPEMIVILENPESGESAVMQDSLYRFSFPTGINAPNTWTTMKLDYGKTYRLKAERPDGATSSVTVTIPDDFPAPRLFVTGLVYDKLYINDVESLVDVQSRWFYQIEYAGVRYKRLIIIPYRDQVEETGADDYILNINTIREEDRVNEQLLLPEGAKSELLGRQIFVATAGPEWDDTIPSFDDLRYALPEVASNIENGVGYMIGIASKSIPYKNCYDENREIISCPAEQPIF